MGGSRIPQTHLQRVLSSVVPITQGNLTTQSESLGKPFAEEYIEALLDGNPFQRENKLGLSVSRLVIIFFLLGLPSDGAL